MNFRYLRDMHGLIGNPKPPLLGCIFPLANEGGGLSLSGLSEGKTVVVAGQGCGQCNTGLFFQLSISISLPMACLLPRLLLEAEGLDLDIKSE
jgi:hypothetical protein